MESDDAGNMPVSVAAVQGGSRQRCATAGGNSFGADQRLRCASGQKEVRMNWKRRSIDSVEPSIDRPVALRLSRSVLTTIRIKTLKVVALSSFILRCCGNEPHSAESVHLKSWQTGLASC